MLIVLGKRWQYDDSDDPFHEGKNANTFAGRDLESGGRVAIKIFEGADGGRAHQRFLREVSLHENLRHEAILELLDRRREGPGPDYIVTPLIDPGSLWIALGPHETLPVSEALEIGLRITDALDYLHTRRERHGDISPGNVLIDAQGKAYLADFGLSKRIGAAPVVTSGDEMDTPGYGPPRKRGTMRTAADDVWSLAATLWFCLSGAPPASDEELRRRQIRNRAVRAPLERALDWGSPSFPDAKQFGQSLRSEWGSLRRDWRAATSRPRRSMLPALAGAGIVGLACAALAGQSLEPQAADAARSTIGDAGLTLSLAGDWHRRSAPSLPAFRFEEPVAAGRGRTTIVAGRAPAVGSGMISVAARRAIPRPARQPRPIVVGDHEALRYGPAARFGGAVEVVAIPLQRKVLVLRCSGPAATLAAACAQASADIKLSRGAPRPLAPGLAVARRLRLATRQLDLRRGQLRAGIASAGRPVEIAAAARKLARANKEFATEVTALPTTGQDRRTVSRAARAADRAGTAYEQLAKAQGDAIWGPARAKVLSRDQRLEAAVDELGSLPVY